MWNHIPTVFYICFVRTCARACALHWPPPPTFRSRPPFSPRLHIHIYTYLFLYLSFPLFLSLFFYLSLFSHHLSFIYFLYLPRSSSQSLTIYLSIIGISQSTTPFIWLSLSLFLMSVRVELAWMCESMFKPRAFRSSCRLRVGGRGYNNRTVFFSPRRVGSIGKGPSTNSSNPDATYRNSL